jgi:hypothetical protein
MVDYGKFAGDFLQNAAKCLHTYTGKLQDLADALTRPLISASWMEAVTMVDVLRNFGFRSGAGPIPKS